MPSPSADQQTILFLTANPQDTSHLRLDRELRDIAEGLQRSQKRDQFKLVQQLAVRPRDIQRAMLDVKPQIIHFSGHGAGEHGLVFEDEIGNTKMVEGDALAGLFELFANQITCVVLNGCYSEIQAKAISQHVPYVIGLKKAIGDKAAIAFAVGFYDALGAGYSIEFAYKLGCSAIRLEGANEHLTPILMGPSIDKNLNLQSVADYPSFVRPIQEEYPQFIPTQNLSHAQLSEPNSGLLRSHTPSPNKIKSIGILLTSIAVATAITTVRALGWLEPVELKAYDWLLQSKPSEPVDERITLITVNSQEMDEWGETEISDLSLYQILDKVVNANPLSIGLDIFRDEPQAESAILSEEGENDYDDLLKFLEGHNQIILACRSDRDKSAEGTRAPSDKIRLAFSNIPEYKQEDLGVVRRQLISMKPDSTSLCKPRYSLGYQIALDYLNKQGIEQRRFEPGTLNYIQLGDTVIEPVWFDTGGYHQLDDAGDQIMLNYRKASFPTLTASDVLDGLDNEELEKIRGKILLIGYDEEGSAAPKDMFNTPFGIKPGVELHAHTASHILSIAIDDKYAQPLIKTWLDPIETMVIALTIAVGVGLGHLGTRFLRVSVIATGSVAIIILVGCWVAFSVDGWWLPLVPSILGLLSGHISVVMLTKWKAPQ